MVSNNTPFRVLEIPLARDSYLAPTQAGIPSCEGSRGMGIPQKDELEGILARAIRAVSAVLLVLLTGPAFAQTARDVATPLVGGDRPPETVAASADGNLPSGGGGGRHGAGAGYAESVKADAMSVPHRQGGIDSDAQPAAPNTDVAGEAWLARFKETGVLFWHDPDGLWTISWHAELGSVRIALSATQPIMVEATAGDATEYNQLGPNTLELAPATDSFGGVIQFRVNDDLEAQVSIDGNWRPESVLVGPRGLRADGDRFVLRPSDGTPDIVRQPNPPDSLIIPARLGEVESPQLPAPTIAPSGRGGSASRPTNERKEKP